MNTHYTLTVKKGQQTAIYSQGVSPLFIRFDGITFFQINKIVWDYGGCDSTDMTRYLILVQRVWRRRLEFKTWLRTVVGLLRVRELRGARFR
jgi:hypothetical protein